MDQGQGTHLHQGQFDPGTNQIELGQVDGTDRSGHRQTHPQHPQDVSSLGAGGDSERGRDDDDGQDGTGVDCEEDVGALRGAGGTRGKPEETEERLPLPDPSGVDKKRVCPAGGTGTLKDC